VDALLLVLVGVWCFATALMGSLLARRRARPARGRRRHDRPGHRL